MNQDTRTYPKISIITPSYNQGAFIERTIKSVLEQNYSNLEYIIIDGGSTDNTVEIIKKYQDKIHYWISEKDKGTYEANNKALEKVTGDFWCVINSDDILFPGAIKKIAEIINQYPHEKWFAGGVEFIDEKDLTILKQIPVKPAPLAGYTFLQSCWILHPGVFLHKDFIDEIGLFEKYHSMDLNYWLRLEKSGYMPHIFNDFVAGLRMHKDCKSIDTVKAHAETLKVSTDFIIKHRLQNITEVKLKIKKDTFQYLKMKLTEQLINNNKSESFEILRKIMVMFPGVLLKKWYWGAIKRFLTGVHSTDPLRKDFFEKQNNSNWNNLDE